MNVRNKGARGERELANVLAGIVGSARRTGQAQSQTDAPEADVEWLEGLLVESKRCERVEIDKWCDKNERQARLLNVISLVGWRKNRGEWRVALPLKDLVGLSKIIVEALNEQEED